MNRPAARAHLLRVYRAVVGTLLAEFRVEALEPAGMTELRQRSSDAVKSRDEREPGRKEKDDAEQRIAAIFARIFGRQFEQVANELRREYTELRQRSSDGDRESTKAKNPPKVPPPNDADLDDLIGELTAALQNGIDLFGKRVAVEINYNLINKEAAQAAREYAYDLIKDIDKTSRNALQTAVSHFVETPGATIGDLEEQVSAWFGESRAEKIAITEVTRAYASGEVMAGEQLQREFPEVRIVKKWYANNDQIVCMAICEPLDGQEAPLNELFEGGYDSPPAHVGCLPGDTLVLPIGEVAAGSKRWYEGDVVIIETLINKLTVTPNHPILTPSGWVAAGLLQEGDNVLGCLPGDWEALSININNEHRISAIEDVFGSLSLMDFRVITTTPDFHGDGAGSDVAVIRPNRKVVNNVKPHFTEPVTQHDLAGRHVVLETSLAYLGAQAQLLESNFSTTASFVSGFDLTSVLLGGHALPFDGFRLGLVTGSDVGLEEALPESPAVDTRFIGKLFLGLAGNISLQEIIKIRNVDFSGHVYNLQTASGLYVAAGIITHNCRCWLETTTALAEL